MLERGGAFRRTNRRDQRAISGQHDAFMGSDNFVQELGMAVEMEDEINFHVCLLHRMECAEQLCLTHQDIPQYSTITATRSIDTDERFISSMLAVEYSLVTPKKEVRRKRIPTSAFEGSRG